MVRASPQETKKEKEMKNAFEYGKEMARQATDHVSQEIAELSDPPSEEEAADFWRGFVLECQLMFSRDFLNG